MASLFDKIKKDVKKGIEEGIAAVKEGASVVSEKMGELTAEGKRQYKMFDLKAKIQSQMTELGGRAYDVLDSKKSPAADSRVKAVYAKIKNLEEQLSKLERGRETKVAAPKKPAAKAKATPKKTTRAAAKKTAMMATKKASTKK
jgi:polyhydroxyalkanoate synthesis regulator phasin